MQGISAEDRARLDEELRTTLATLRDLRVPDPEEAESVKDLRRQIADARADAEAEADVYGHLANFFARYYAEGDFMSQRRYSGGGGPAYLIPYDGEEVKLHWANADQYYVKTTENYASYVFAAGDDGRRVRFEIASADNEKDNVKEAAGRQRRFVLAGTTPVAVEGDDLVVRFEHRPLTDARRSGFRATATTSRPGSTKAAAERILNFKSLDQEWLARLSAPAPTEANGDRTVLEKHLERYTAKNSFDYFIHKDLAGFLRRELDLYLKSEVLNLDDLAAGDAARLRRALARVRTIRHMADKIIDFLAQLEDFQKRLWLKKKLVLETNWCVTLDRVPEGLYPEIAANEKQREEWVDAARHRRDRGRSRQRRHGLQRAADRGIPQGEPVLWCSTPGTSTRTSRTGCWPLCLGCRPPRRADGRSARPRRELPGPEPASGALSRAGTVCVYRSSIQHGFGRIRLSRQLSALLMACDAEESVDRCSGVPFKGRGPALKH